MIEKNNNSFVTSLFPEETKAITEIIKKFKKLKYLEVGIWKGGTVKSVLETIKENNIEGEVIGIDLFEDFVENENNTHTSGNFTKESLEKGFTMIGFPNVKLLKGDSVKMLQTFEPQENIVIFIDGNHTYQGCLNDYLEAKRIVKKGYIIFHNATKTEVPDKRYYEKDGGVYKVVEEIVKKDYPQIERIARCVIVKVGE